mmetsp:Transcript_105444/g.304388  ORF Transcript_105444/g.304388 Transcript_105444/m.304388 type:complete len:213 (+) Transcript_105444:2963-3601(+)
MVDHGTAADLIDLNGRHTLQRLEQLLDKLYLLPTADALHAKLGALNMGGQRHGHRSSSSSSTAAAAATALPRLALLGAALVVVTPAAAALFSAAAFFHGASSVKNLNAGLRSPHMGPLSPGLPVEHTGVQRVCGGVLGANATATDVESRPTKMPRTLMAACWSSLRVHRAPAMMPRSPESQKAVESQKKIIEIIRGQVWPRGWSPRLLRGGH